MTLHRARRPYTDRYARRKLEQASATLAHWQALKPKDWRERADQHQALQVWGAEVDRWQRVLTPPPVERAYLLPF